QINMAGIIDPKTGLPITLTPNGTFFVTEDNILQGLKITKAGSTSLKTDLVFTVDNSGSMGGEADSIATKIGKFVNYLASKGLDLKVGIVGYDDGGDVSGAINFTTATEVYNYVNRASLYGTSRTKGFAGTDATPLQTAASGYASAVYGENGIVGITFADSLFAWRSGAQRIYINFTDEPTQPSNQTWFSTDGFVKRWSGKGTVHTVWSGGDTATAYAGYWQKLVYEKPWDLSLRTGGTIKSVATNAADLDLTTLPVTGALAQSVLVEFLTSNPTGTHTVKLTVTNGQTGAGASDGQKIFSGVKYK
ncbi:MAG: VWA domain-containing protein, partial [Chlorobiales bacterium]|nr:VWA domain-containing protein [Chlorobiales bacterium]